MVEADEEPDTEDIGEKGYNYRSERFANRLKRNSGMWGIFRVMKENLKCKCKNKYRKMACCFELGQQGKEKREIL